MAGKYQIRMKLQLIGEAIAGYLASHAIAYQSVGILPHWLYRSAFLGCPC
jgi:hypothetical protein